MEHLIGFCFLMIVVSAEFLAVFAYGWKLCLQGVETNGLFTKAVRFLVICGLLSLVALVVVNIAPIVSWIGQAPGHILAWLQALPRRADSFYKDPCNREFLVLNSVFDAVLILLWAFAPKRGNH